MALDEYDSGDCPFDDRFFLGGCDHETVTLADIVPLGHGYMAYDEPVNGDWLHDIFEQSIASVVPIVAIIPHDALDAALRAEGNRVTERAKRPRPLRFA